MPARAAITIVFILAPLSAAAASEASAPPSSEPGAASRGELEKTVDEEAGRKFLHGFRLGYLYAMGLDTPADPDSENAETLAEKYNIKSAHQFTIGYEVTWRMVGHDWLNVLLVGNLMVSGLEQSRFYPGLNTLLGFEIAETVQFGVGVNAVPTTLKPAHMLIAAGWTPKIGDIYTPIHAFFVPDVDGHHRTGLTIGVNW